MLLVSSLVYAAVRQRVDGRVFYDNGSLVSVGSNIPVLWYYEAHDAYSYTLTGGTLWAYPWTSYYSFGEFMGNNSQWQTVWACNETHYGMNRYRLNNSEACTISRRCHDIVINMSVLEHPVLDSDGDGLCYYFDDTSSAPEPGSDIYSCFGIPYNDTGDVCSDSGRCIAEDTCICDVGYSGDDCSEYGCSIPDSNREEICSDKGESVGVLKECECDEGYSGNDCSMAPAVTCFGVAFDNANVCSGRGLCVAQDDCECSEDWTGDECQDENIYISDWEVMFINRLSTYVRDTFHAGGGNATDEYDFGIDVPQLGLPSDAKAVQMRTLVDGHRLTKDYRSIDLPKTWEIKLIAFDDGDEEGLNGQNTLTWNLTNVSDSIVLTLVDYGDDSSRTNVVETIDLKDGFSYIFDVSDLVLGSYRYLDLVAESYWCGGADMNRDGHVDLNDFVILRRNFGATSCSAPNWCDNADMDKNGVVDVKDYGVLVANFGRGCIVAPIAAPEIQQKLKQGWNLFSPAAELINSDRNIQLKKGWNLFGYSSEEPFKWSEALVDNKDEVKTISEAQVAGWLQSTVYYFDEDSQTYEFVPGDDEYLRVNNGYWLHAIDELTLILPNAGSFDGISYDWIDVTVSKDGEVKTISEAQALGWLQGTIYYFDEDSQTYEFVPGDDEKVYPGKGYWLYSNEEVSLIVS